MTCHIRNADHVLITCFQTTSGSGGTDLHLAAGGIAGIAAGAFLYGLDLMGMFYYGLGVVQKLYLQTNDISSIGHVCRAL